jgi:hypothetical protein
MTRNQRKRKKQNMRDWHRDREDERYKDTSTEGDIEIRTWRENRENERKTHTHTHRVREREIEREK